MPVAAEFFRKTAARRVARFCWTVGTSCFWLSLRPRRGCRIVIDNPNTKFPLKSGTGPRTRRRAILSSCTTICRCWQPFDTGVSSSRAAGVAGDVYGVKVAAHDQVSVSSNGVLAFVTHSAINLQLVWFDRQGDGTAPLRPAATLAVVRSFRRTASCSPSPGAV